MSKWDRWAAWSALGITFLQAFGRNMDADRPGWAIVGLVVGVVLLLVAMHRKSAP